MTGIEMRSEAFADHGLMPERVSKQGGNASPPLRWSGVPTSAAELVLLCEDPDSGDPPFLHWLVTGIDPATTGLGEGEEADGRLWPNDFGGVGWDGPNPPKGDDPHRYFFRLYAVSEPLPLSDKPTAPQVHEALDEREIASGVLVGTYAR